MREAITAILSWLSITLVFMVAFYFDGFEFNVEPIKSFLMLGALVGFISLLYFIFLGLPVIYYLSRREQVAGYHFIFAGIAVSLPMVLVAALSHESEWVVASLVAGFIGGLVFAILLPNKQYT